MLSNDWMVPVGAGPGAPNCVMIVKIVVKIGEVPDCVKGKMIVDFKMYFFLCDARAFLACAGDRVFVALLREVAFAVSTNQCAVA